ncbi:hypothetical protein BC829DRAFT_400161 [Chytridium lagenaria]|nr:hypothetical protein BC829DRAFT_400161 [Chytridium lagenaria]
MSRALTDTETEKLLSSFQALHARLRILSSENLRRLEAESHVQRPFCKHKGTCTGNAARGMLKAFAILYAIKYALITGQIYRKPATLIKIGGRDTISFALFLSTFISSYKGALCFFRRLRKTSDALNPFFAGCRHVERLLFGRKSEIALLEDLEESEHKHNKHGHRHKKHRGQGGLPDAREIPAAPLQLTAAEETEKKESVRNTAGTLVMMLSSSQILYAYVCEPQSLARSYLSFLLTHGGFLPTHDDPHLAPPLFSSTIPDGLPKDRLLPYQDFIGQVPHDFVMCAMQHPHTTDCESGVLRAFKGEWWRALALYGPLNGIMTIIFRGRDLLKHPKRNAIEYAKSTLRSTLFLTAYVTMSWCVPCYFPSSVGKDQTWMYYVNGLLAGSMVLIEAPGRRLELGMYCLPRALESLWNSGVGWGWWQHVSGLYFCVATGVLMTLYQKDPASIHDG